MWSAASATGHSGQQQSSYGERLLLDQHRQTINGISGGGRTLTPSSSLTSKRNSCFDTPLSSETSDLDETSSDLEAEVDVDVGDCVEQQLCDRLQPASDDDDSGDNSSVTFGEDILQNQEFAFYDHCYYTTKTSRSNCSITGGNRATDTAAVTTKHVTTSSRGGSNDSSTITFRLPSSFPTTATRYRRSNSSSNNSLIKSMTSSGSVAGRNRTNQA